MRPCVRTGPTALTIQYFFLVPRSVVGTYGLASIRSSVRSSVCSAEISNLFIGIFLFLAQSWGFLMRRKWHFRIFLEKSRLAHFGKKLTIFGQKSTFRPISQNLLIGSSYFCIFKLYFGSIYEITQWKLREKSRFGPFWFKNTLHVLTKWCFRRFLANFFQSVDVVWSKFVIWTIFIVYLWKKWI